MNYSTVLHAIGWLVLVLAVACILPWATALFLGEKASLAAFSFAFLFYAFLGGALVMAFRDIKRRTSKLELLMLVASSWLSVALLAAIPIYGAGALDGFLDAYFEALSGFTTTGASVIPSLDETERAVLIWRAMLQWMGGIATIVMGAAVLAPLGVGGMSLRVSPLTRADKSRALDRFRGTAEAILGIYTSITAAVFLGLLISGIPTFDAFCLSLSTISTGGFTTTDAGLNGYDAPFAMWILFFAMLMAGTSFATHRSAIRNGGSEYQDDPEVAYLAMIVLIGGLFLSIAGFEETRSFSKALSGGFFTAASLATSTGFVPPVTAGISPLSTIFVIGLVLIGGATLSTAGGIKLMRLALLLKQGGRELKRLSHPHGIIPTNFGGRPVSIQLMKSIWVFFVLFLSAYAVTTILLSASGLRFETALVAAAAAIGNAGPAYDIVRLGEPEMISSYANMGTATKIILMVAMVIGRLELLALLALFGREQWRR
ncbi:MAG: potassium transporter TrkG [Parvibaculum sp.]